MSETKSNAEENPTKGEVEDTKISNQKASISWRKIFIFADYKDVILMVLGSLCSMIGGASMPAFMLIFGGIFRSLAQYQQEFNLTAPNISTNFCPVKESLIDRISSTYLIYFAIFVGVMVVVHFLQEFCWRLTSTRQVTKLHKAFFRGLVRQDQAFFDFYGTGKIIQHITGDAVTLEDGLSSRIGHTINSGSMYIAATIMALIQGWKLALVMIALYTPTMFIKMFALVKIQNYFAQKMIEEYGGANQVSEEALSGIQTVQAYNAIPFEISKYNSKLDRALKFGHKKSVLLGLSWGMMLLVLYSVLSFGIWFAGYLFRNEPDQFDPSKFFTVFLIIQLAAQQLGQMLIGVEELLDAKASALNIFSIMNRVPDIDSLSESGKKPNSISGQLNFENVGFSYPSRKENEVLHNFHLSVKPGQTVALVGESGCGKSTALQLLLRLYDVDRGRITIDGEDIKNLNVRWLRQSVGFVTQMPTLFGGTIKENIRAGHPSASDDDVFNAAKQANIHGFILQLPDKYETLLSQSSTQISGGQRQRIAIARALVKNPKLLLLDEATSALDTESEVIVQGALERAREGRTTLIVAHRLSTIKSAEIIAVLDKGKIVEQGTHSQLIASKGKYYQMVVSQEEIVDQEEKAEVERMDGFKHRLDDIEEDGSFIRASAKGKELASRTRSSFRDSRDERRSSWRKASLTPSIGFETTAEDIASHVEVKETQYTPRVIMKRLGIMSKPDLKLIIVGLICTMLKGTEQPIRGLMFSSLLGAMADPNVTNMDQKLLLPVYVLFGLGVGLCITNLASYFFLGTAGSNLTMRARRDAYSSMLRQDQSWFDKIENSVGNLTTYLARDSELLHGAFGGRLGTIIQAMTALLIGIIASLSYSWKICLCLLPAFPLMLLGFIFRAKATMSSKNRGQTVDDDDKEASDIAIGTIENMKNITTLALENNRLECFYKSLDFKDAHEKRSSVIHGIAYTYASNLMRALLLGALILGAYLVEICDSKADDVFISMIVFFVATFSIGEIIIYAPNYGQAVTAAGNLLRIIDQIPSIDNQSTKGFQPEAPATGVLAFDKVYFRYESRPNIKVLDGFKATVGAGQTLALVGASGCGKSTVVKLLQRFYNVSRGAILLDNHEIGELNLDWLRSQMAMVSQDPVLFSGTITENILYGTEFSDDEKKERRSMQDVMEAAKSANAHDFVSILPQSYETFVGEKGCQLSGGQKQRICIARALLRRPRILLLDESTSALDSESERVVQEALDRAKVGRTCIIIAHRLSTIKNADMIGVMKAGRIVEIGTHEQLKDRKGFYYDLLTANVNDESRIAF